MLLQSPKSGGGASTGSTPSSSITHGNLLGLFGSTSYYHVSSGVWAALTSGLSTGYAMPGDNVSEFVNDKGYTTGGTSTGSTPSSSIDHNSTLNINGSTSYYHVSSGVFAALTSGLSTTYASTGSTPSSSIDHQSLLNLNGSSSYYHVSSGVYNVLTTGLSSSYNHDEPYESNIAGVTQSSKDCFLWQQQGLFHEIELMPFQSNVLSSCIFRI